MPSQTGPILTKSDRRNDASKRGKEGGAVEDGAPVRPGEGLAETGSQAAAGAARSAEVEPVVVEIRPRRGWIGLDWPEMLHYRELLYFLVWRDVKVRYKQTVLGVAWAVLPPVFTMIVFTVIFGNVANLPSDGMSYAVFSYAALLPFNFFSTGISQAGQSLINQQHLLTKVYFPRLFVPTASVGSALVDLAISFGAYAVILACYKVVPGWQVVFLPLLVLMAILATLGLGFLLAALTVSYRDFRYVLPFLVQAFMYVSPVIWSLDSVPENRRWLLALNPMTGVIDGFRWCIYGHYGVKQWNPEVVAVSAAVTVALFTLGLFYFRKTERRFADIA